MEQSEHQHRDFRVRFHVEDPLEAVDVLEALVDDRQTDDSVDDVGVDADIGEDTDEQRQAVTKREQTDVEDNILQPVEEKDDPDQKQQMVVAGHHMLRTQIQKRTGRRSVDRLDEPGVAALHRMGVERGLHGHDRGTGQNEDEQHFPDGAHDVHQSTSSAPTRRSEWRGGRTVVETRRAGPDRQRGQQSEEGG